jgi:hypothetical protein
MSQPQAGTSCVLAPPSPITGLLTASVLDLDAVAASPRPAVDRTDTVNCTLAFLNASVAATPPTSAVTVRIEVPPGRGMIVEGCRATELWHVDVVVALGPSAWAWLRDWRVEVRSVTVDALSGRRLENATVVVDRSTNITCVDNTTTDDVHAVSVVGPDAIEGYTLVVMGRSVLSARHFGNHTYRDATAGAVRASGPCPAALVNGTMCANVTSFNATRLRLLAVEGSNLLAAAINGSAGSYKRAVALAPQVLPGTFVRLQDVTLAAASGTAVATFCLHGCAAMGLSSTQLGSGPRTSVVAVSVTIVAHQATVEVECTAACKGATALGVAAFREVANVTNLTVYAAESSIRVRCGQNGEAVAALGAAAYAANARVFLEVSMSVLVSDTRIFVRCGAKGMGVAAVGLASCGDGSIRNNAAVVSATNVTIGASALNLTVQTVAEGVGVAAGGIAASFYDSSASVIRYSVHFTASNVTVTCRTAGYSVAILGIAADSWTSRTTVTGFAALVESSVLTMDDNVTQGYGAAILGAAASRNSELRASLLTIRAVDSAVVVRNHGGCYGVAALGVAGWGFETFTNVTFMSVHVERCLITLFCAAGQGVTALGVVAAYTQSSARQLDWTTTTVHCFDVYVSRSVITVSATSTADGMSALGVVAHAGTSFGGLKVRALATNFTVTVMHTNITAVSAFSGIALAALGVAAGGVSSATCTVSNTTWLAVASNITLRSKPAVNGTMALTTSPGYRVSGDDLQFLACDSILDPSPPDNSSFCTTRCSFRLNLTAAVDCPSLSPPPWQASIPAPSYCLIARPGAVTVLDTRTPTRTVSATRIPISATWSLPITTQTPSRHIDSVTLTPHLIRRRESHTTTPAKQFPSEAPRLTSDAPATAAPPSPSSGPAVSSITFSVSLPVLRDTGSDLEAPRMPPAPVAALSGPATVTTAAAVLVSVALSSVLLPSAASQPARLMAIASLVRCGSGLEEPSALEHPLRLSFPATSPPADAGADDAESREVCGGLASAAISSTLLASGVVVAALATLLPAGGPGLARVAKHVGSFAGAALAYLGPNAVAAMAGVAMRGWVLWAVMLVTAVLTANLVVLAYVAGVAGPRKCQEQRDQKQLAVPKTPVWAALSDAFGVTAHPSETPASSGGAPRDEKAPPVQTLSEKWHYFVDVAVALAVAALTGLQPYDIDRASTPCRWLSLAVCLIMFLFAAHLVIHAPLRDPWERWMAVAGAIGQVVQVLVVSAVLFEVSTSAVGLLDTLTLILSAQFVVQPVVLALRSLCQKKSDTENPESSAADTYEITAATGANQPLLELAALQGTPSWSAGPNTNPPAQTQQVPTAPLVTAITAAPISNPLQRNPPAPAPPAYPKRRTYREG